MREIDLRYVPASCTSHPVIVLANTLKDLEREGVEKFKLIFNVDDIPVNAIKFFLSKHGYCVEEERPLDNKSMSVLASRCGKG
ncbi:MAG: hypothetical protein QW632_02080 [Ignisphaera sp.]